MAKMGPIAALREHILNPVLRIFAYYTAMTLYTIVQWHPDLLKNTNLDIITLMAVATQKRNPDAADYFKGVVMMRDNNE